MTDSTISRPRRGEVWLVALGAAREGEIGKTRPAVVVSVDGLQAGTPYDRITVVPLTASARQRPNMIQPRVPAGQGLEHDSVVLCDAPRAILVSRFVRRLGTVSDEVFGQIIQARCLVEGWDDVRFGSGLEPFDDEEDAADFASGASRSLTPRRIDD